MLNDLLDVLDSDESISVSLSKDGKGNPRLVLQARIDFDPDETDESVRSLKAALARPLVLRLDKDEDADQAIRDAIAGFAGEQRSSRDALRDYKADQVASRAAVKAAAATKATKPESTKKEKTADKKADSEASNPAPAPEAADPAANPASLF